MAGITGVLGYQRIGDALVLRNGPQGVFHRVVGHRDESAQVHILAVERLAIESYVQVGVDRRYGVRYPNYESRIGKRYGYYRLGHNP